MHGCRRRRVTAMLARRLDELRLHVERARACAPPSRPAAARPAGARGTGPPSSRRARSRGRRASRTSPRGSTPAPAATPSAACPSRAGATSLPPSSCAYPLTLTSARRLTCQLPSLDASCTSSTLAHGSHASTTSRRARCRSAPTIRKSASASSCASRPRSTTANVPRASPLGVERRGARRPRRARRRLRAPLRRPAARWSRRPRAPAARGAPARRAPRGAAGPATSASIQTSSVRAALAPSLARHVRDDERVHEAPEVRRERRVGAERIVLGDDELARDPELAQARRTSHERLPSCDARNVRAVSSAPARCRRRSR